MSSTPQSPKLSNVPTPKPQRPNEVGAISVQGFVRIFDPQTQKTYVEKRA